MTNKKVIRKPTVDQLKKNGKFIKRNELGSELYNYKGIEYVWWANTERVESRLYQRRMYGNQGSQFPYKFKKWY